MTRTKSRTARGTRRGRGQPNQGEQMPTFRDDSEDLLDAIEANPMRAHRLVRKSLADKTAALQRLRVDHNGRPLADDEPDSHVAIVPTPPTAA